LNDNGEPNVGLFEDDGDGIMIPVMVGDSVSEFSEDEGDDASLAEPS
jgi:hypothetical protein